MSGRPGTSWPNASASAAAAGWTSCASVVRSLVDNDGITYIQVDRHGDAVTNGDGAAAAGSVASRRVAAADLGGRLGHAGIRSGAALPAARRGADRPVRPAPVDHQRRAAAAAAVRPSRLRARRPRHRGARAATSCSCTAATSAAPRDGELPGQRRLDAGAVGRGLRAGRPPRGRARDSRPVRADRAAARVAVGAGAAAGADRRRARVRRGAGGRGAQPGHPLRDRVRPGLSGQRAGLPAGGERRPGGARRQAVDAVAGHAQAGRRGAAPGRRRLRRPAGPARRFAAGRGRAGRGAAPRRGDRGQHAGQRHPGKPWAASLSARAGRAAARRDAAAADRAGVLGRHRRRAFAPAGATCRRC